MTDCQMRVVCPACGYVTEDVYAIGGAVMDGGFFEVTVACPVTHRLVDAEAGHLNDFGIIEPDGAERELTEDDVYEATDRLTAFMSSTVCPECGKKHPSWDEKTAVCPVCAKPGCKVEIVRH